MVLPVRANVLLPIATEPTTLDESAGTRAEDQKLPEYDVCPIPTAASAPPAIFSTCALAPIATLPF